MIFGWLAAWLVWTIFGAQPVVRITPDLNVWAIALVACIAIDVCITNRG